MPGTHRQPAEKYRTLAVERQADGTAVLAFSVPGHSQNVLTQEVFVELARALDEIAAGPPPRAIILRSGKPGSFFAGADIERLERLHTLGRAERPSAGCAAQRGPASPSSTAPASAAASNWRWPATCVSPPMPRTRCWAFPR
jgi:enoyl-CoA hydratase/carnithine racemase